jgi:cobalt-zinc-cadmium efflux system membrane fusion protein
MKYLYIILALLVFTACRHSEKNNEIVASKALNPNEIIISESQFNSEKLKLGQLENKPLHKTIKTTGMIDVPPQNKSVISTFLGGYITNTPLLIGDRVKKGDLLVTLENPEFIELQQEYLEVSEQLNYLKAEFSRQKTLFDENISSQKNFLKAESTYKSSLAHCNGLRKKLVMLNINPSSVEKGNITSSINVYAPIDGYITKVNINNGTYVSPADTIMEIVDTDHIHLELSVFEKDILNIKEGQPILFKIPEASDRTFSAEVHLVGTTIDENNRFVKVHGHLIDESEANFIVGMFVEADIILNSKNALAFPKAGIIEINGSHFALVLDRKENNSFYFEKVKLSIDLETETFVTLLNSEVFLNKTILVEGGFMFGENVD